MIGDLHSHILPGVDDGSKSTAQSLKMLDMEAAQGITHVVLTPHFYPRRDTPEAFLSRRAAAMEQLTGAMAGREDLPRLILGAEIHYAPGISNWDVLPQLTMGNSACLLVELPPPPWSESCYRELELIRLRRGLVPVVAHIDRYIAPFRTCGIPERLAELPVLVQANAEFFLAPATSRLALKMLRKDRIHLLGSDCHNLTDRKPNLGAALAKIEAKLGSAALSRIETHSNCLLEEA